MLHGLCNNIKHKNQEENSTLSNYAIYALYTSIETEFDCPNEWIFVQEWRYLPGLISAIYLLSLALIQYCKGLYRILTMFS